MSYNPIYINHQHELDSFISNGIIIKDIVIKGENPISFDSVHKIDGLLGLSETTLKSLGNIQEITGGFWISATKIESSIKSLNKLEYVGGDVSLRLSSVIDLGELKIVGGNLSLRDTKITNLGKLKLVKGDLSLPKHLEEIIDLSNIVVKGKTKYWNDKRQVLELNPLDYLPVEEMAEMELLRKKNIITGNYIYYHAGMGFLTTFGRNNIMDVISFANKQLDLYMKDKGCSFFELFYKINRERERLEPFKFEYYKNFYLNEKDYEHYYTIDNGDYYGGYVYHVVQNAIKNQFRIILKGAEDLYRESIGLPKIGEGWINETQLFYKIENAFPEFKVKQHQSPKWLGRQHLDIYILELNIGIEYQGTQHYEPVDFFGGVEALKKTMERDERKMRLCKENNCNLIIVDEKYDIEEVIKKIKDFLI